MERTGKLLEERAVLPVVQFTKALGYWYACTIEYEQVRLSCIDHWCFYLLRQYYKAAVPCAKFCNWSIFGCRGCGVV